MNEIQKINEICKDNHYCKDCPIYQEYNECPIDGISPDRWDVDKILDILEDID